MKPANLLFIMSDEHNKRMLGCHGHQIGRPILIVSRRAGCVSPMPIATLRSACPRVRAFRPAAMSTTSGFGTIASRMTGPFRLGRTGCVKRVIVLIRSASCISAALRMTMVSARSICRSISWKGLAIQSGCCAIHRRGAWRRSSLRWKQVVATRLIRATTTGLRRRQKTGCANARKIPTVSRGCFSFRSCARTFR